jgi:hypothetical protein
MAAVFSMQGAGQFGAALVALLTTIGFRESFSTASSVSTCRDACQLAANRFWRIIIGAGAFPAIFALYCNYTRVSRSGSRRRRTLGRGSWSNRRRRERTGGDYWNGDLARLADWEGGARDYNCGGLWWHGCSAQTFVHPLYMPTQ